MQVRTVAAALALIAAASFTIASGSSSNSGGASASGGSTAGSETSNGGGGGAQIAGLNQPALDGKFQFTVKSVKCGVKKVGDVLEAKAQGQFCLVTMNVKNVGTEAQTFDASSQEAKNGEITYKADGSASIYANKDPNTFLNQINPGNAVNAVVVFDIPKDGKIQTLVLHDSPFSGGVEVKVA